jgi:hypothetical protein
MFQTTLTFPVASVPAGLHPPVAARPSHHTAMPHRHHMAKYRPYYQKGKCDKDCFPAFAATTAVMFLFFFTHFCFSIS